MFAQYKLGHNYKAGCMLMRSKADKPLFTPTEESSFLWFFELISLRILYEYRYKSLSIVRWELFETTQYSEEDLPSKSWTILQSYATCSQVSSGEN